MILSLKRLFHKYEYNIENITIVNLEDGTYLCDIKNKCRKCGHIFSHSYAPNTISINYNDISALKLKCRYEIVINIQDKKQFYYQVDNINLAEEEKQKILKDGYTDGNKIEYKPEEISSIWLIPIIEF